MNLIKSKVGIIMLLMALFFGVSNTNLKAQVNAKKSTIEEKAKELVSKMTLEEKIGMIVGDGRFLSDLKVEKVDAVWIASRNSKMVIPRISIKTTALTDGPSGINKGPAPEGAKDYTYTTSFPTSTCLPSPFQAPAETWPSPWLHQKRCILLLSWPHPLLPWLGVNPATDICKFQELFSLVGNLG